MPLCYVSISQLFFFFFFFFIPRVKEQIINEGILVLLNICAEPNFSETQMKQADRISVFVKNIGVETIFTQKSLVHFTKKQQIAH